MRIVVLGATGSVGRGILSVLDETAFVPQDVPVLALGSPHSAGKQVSMGESRVLSVESADSFVFQPDDWVFSAVKSEIARAILPKAQAAGARIIDKSSAFRRAWPLVVPEVNAEIMTSDVRCVASPNCVAIPLAMVLKPLHDLWGVSRVVASTYQAVSGAGKKGLDTLFAETRHVLMTSAPSLENSPFPNQIAFNTIPQIGGVDAEGASEEEEKIQNEVPLLLECNFPVHVTAVRVPVFVGHGVAVTVDFQDQVALLQAAKVLKSAPGVVMPRALATSMDCAGEDAVQVGRLRVNGPRTLSLWAACDNLRKGAALNAVHVAQEMYRRI